MAFRILMFSDFVCPFCYIGFEVMRKLQPEFGFDLEWRGFQIHPEWPAEGIPPDAARSRTDPDVRRAAWRRIAEMGKAAGLEMRPPSVLTNSRVALKAAEFAGDTGDLGAFEERVYRAYFHDGENIGDMTVVTRLAAEVGMNPDQVNEAILSPWYDLKLKNNALQANQRGVSGVPTFFIGDYPLVGAQSEEAMRLILKRAGERMAAAG